MSERTDKLQKIADGVIVDIKGLEEHFGQVIDKVLSDSRDVIALYPSLIDLLDDVIDVVDSKTNTGLVDVVDGIVARQAVRLFIKPKHEAKFIEMRDALIKEIGKIEG